MSYWSHNPETYDQIIYDRMVEDGLVAEDDDREIYDIVAEHLDKPGGWQTAVEAERDYWAGRIDEACHRQDCREDR